MSSVKSIGFPVRIRATNTAIKTVGIPIKPRAVNQVSVYSILFPKPKNACIVVKDRAGNTVSNYTFSIGSITYTSDVTGKAFVYLPEETEVSVTGAEGTYLAYSANVTRPTEFDQGYFEHVIILDKRYRYKMYSIRGNQRSEASNVVEVTK